MMKKLLLLFILTTLSFANIQGTIISDPTTGKALNIESNGGAAVNIQDQHTPAFDIFFSKLIARTSLFLDATEDDYSITVTPGHGIGVDEQLVIFDTSTLRAYVGDVIGVNGDVVSLDRAIQADFLAATSIISRTSKDLNVDGSVTRQTFVIAAPIAEELDIVRIMFQMITTAAPDFNKFGDIGGGLLRGVVLRVVNSRKTNLFNVKTNGELVNLMYDVTAFDPSNPGQGVYGIGGRLTYGGQSKHGVTLRLQPGDTLELIIQDDLTSLLLFRMIAGGHVVTD